MTSSSEVKSQFDAKLTQLESDQGATLTDDVDDGLEGPQDAAQDFGVLLSQVLVQHHAQVTHQLLLRGGDSWLALPLDLLGLASPRRPRTSWQVFMTTAVREMRSAACWRTLADLLLRRHSTVPQICGRYGLTRFPRALTTVPKPFSITESWEAQREVRQVNEIFFFPFFAIQRPDAESTTHFCRLLLEGVEDPVDQLLLQLVVDVGGAQVAHDLLDGLHHHLAVLLRLVLQVVHDAGDDLRRAHLVGQLHRGVHQLEEESGISK